MDFRIYDVHFWLVSIMCLICFSLEFDPTDNYLIDCGSPTNTSVGNRVFVADASNSSLLSTPAQVFVTTNSQPNTIITPELSSLLQTARILNGDSTYTFPIKKCGRHYIRLYFFPFVDKKGNYNLSNTKFSVSAQGITLLRDFQPQNGLVKKEYSLNISSASLVLTFSPSENSFAFVNALELFSLPSELIPDSAQTLSSTRENLNLSSLALETVARVNMGNVTVSTQNDTLWRFWDSDEKFLQNTNLVKFVSNLSLVNYTKGFSQDIAPRSVYGTATRLDSQFNPNALVNMTWFFDVDPGFEYMVRFHFCDIVSSALNTLYFDVYTNSLFVADDLDLDNLTSNVLSAPYYIDVVTSVSQSDGVSISIGPSNVMNAYPDGILNGLEIMKISNSKGSLDVMDAEIQSSSSSSKVKVWIIAGSASGVFLVSVVMGWLFYLGCQRRRSRHSQVIHYPQESVATNETAIISESKIGYRFPLVAVQDATDKFSQSLLIGVGGFGMVYKGVLWDGRKVAVKRGVRQSHEGLAEFRTEIEMLSQFRHRHLVSLIGYCDEQNEMIIIYEYMENGTLKNHLYGSDLPRLSWRQRLEICIGAARGLHYLHTGSSNAIIHRDVKSANILLDENLLAKVADFGISKHGPEMDHTHVSTAVKGSFGYLDPEYMTTQQLTEKSDVYSFGVVMFEVLCGRPVIDPSLPREMVNLVEWAMEWHKKGELENVVDPHIVGSMKPESVTKFGKIAEKCLAERGADRPTMGEVLWNLEGLLQVEGQPRMNAGRSDNHFETSVSSTQYSVGSANDIAGVSMSKVFSEMVHAEMR